MKPYYQHEGITIFHGDCREILPTLEPVDLVLTDPPYGILNLQNGQSGAIRKSPRSQGSGKLRDRLLNTASISWDVAPSDEIFEAMRQLSLHQIIWGGNYFPLPPTRGILVWDKQQPWPNFSQAEIAWTSTSRPAAVFRQTNSIEGKLHPTQKPLNLMRWCLEFFPDADTILDPFMGSGTTLRAAKDLGRKAIGIEIKEKYCEIAAKRMSQEVINFGQPDPSRDRALSAVPGAD